MNWFMLVQCSSYKCEIQKVFEVLLYKQYLKQLNKQMVVRLI